MGKISILPGAICILFLPNPLFHIKPLHKPIKQTPPNNPKHNLQCL